MTLLKTRYDQRGPVPQDLIRALQFDKPGRGPGAGAAADADRSEQAIGRADAHRWPWHAAAAAGLRDGKILPVGQD